MSGTARNQQGGAAKKQRQKRASMVAVGVSAAEASPAPLGASAQARMTEGTGVMASSKRRYLLGKAIATMVQHERQNGSKGDRQEARVMHEAKGLPVREGLSMLYKVERDKAILDGMLFTCHFLVYLVIAFLLYDVHTVFAQVDAFTDLFIDEEFDGATYKKNFNEVETQWEMWTWLNGPMVAGFYPNEHYSGEPYAVGDLGYILGYHRLVGGVRLRQLRVRNDSCAILDEFKFTKASLPAYFTNLTDAEGREQLDTACFAPFELGETDAREPFGGVSSGTEYTWRGDLPHLDGLFNYGPEYGEGGYVVDLPTALNGTANAAVYDLVNTIQNDRWTDESTRALAVYATVYNINTRFATTMRFLFEYFPSGKVIRSFRIYSMPMVLYDSTVDAIRGIFEFIFVISIGYFLQKTIRRARRMGPKVFLRKAEHWFDAALIILEICLVLFWGTFASSNVRRDIDVNSEEFVDYFDLGATFVSVTSLAGLVGIMMAVKLFSFFSLNRRMNILWSTLGRAAEDLVAFLISFFLIVMGFAMMGEFLFGFMLTDFRSLWFSFQTLLRYVLGDFQYDDLSDVRPELAGFFFNAYTLLVILSIMNMVISIVISWFDIVHDETKNSERWKESAPRMEADFAARFTICRRQCTRHTRGYCWSGLNACCSCGPCKHPNDRGPDQEIPEGGKSLCGSLKVHARHATIAYHKAQARRKRRLEKSMSLAELEAKRRSWFQCPTGGSTSDMHSSGPNAAEASNPLQQLRPTSPTSKDEGEEEEELDSTWTEDVQMLTWQREAVFLSALHDAARHSKRNNNVDLFAHLLRVYEDNGNDDFLFIGWEELHSLTAPPEMISRSSGATVGGPEQHPDSPATKLLTAYFNLKEVMVVGAWRHEREQEACQHYGLPVFDVIKFNKGGSRLNRLIYLDKERGQLLNFDKATHAFRKRFPLTQLVQFEWENEDEAEVSLVFTSQGIPHEENKAMNGLDTRFTLRFKSPVSASEFLRQVEEAIAKLELQIQGMVEQGEGEDEEEELASKKKKKKNAKRKSKGSFKDIAGHNSTQQVMSAAVAKISAASMFSSMLAARRDGSGGGGGAGAAK